MGGILGILLTVVGDVVSRLISSGRCLSGTFNRAYTAFICLFVAFGLAWTIMGGVYVYGSYSEVDYFDSGSREFCDGMVYTFSFVMVTTAVVVSGLAVIQKACWNPCCSPDKN